jgi:hypothetical protein
MPERTSQNYSSKLKFGPKFSFNFSKRFLSPNLYVFDDFSCFFSSKNRATSGNQDTEGQLRVSMEGLRKDLIKILMKNAKIGRKIAF